MVTLNHYDWTINFCNSSYCWINQKRIDIDINYSGDIRQIILHEISHIDTAIYCNQKHNPDFWKKMNYLVRKFLKTDLYQYQKKHMVYMTIGFYKLSYKNK